MVRSNQLLGAMVRLAPADYFIAVLGSLGQLVGPVHPEYARVHVMLVACTDLQDARDPIVLRPLERNRLPRLGIGKVLLLFNASLVGHIDEALAKVLDVIH